MASTCLPTVRREGVREFKEPLTGDALTEMSHKNFSSETMKKVRWVRKMYREWHQHQHERGLQYIACDIEDKATIMAESATFAFCRFITEIKKLNGEEYPGKTLYNIVVCLQFHLETLGFSFKLIDNLAFRDLRFTLDNSMKARTAAGVGVMVKQAQALTAFDEDLLWVRGMLGTDTPDQLLNTVIFLVGKGFALRAGMEHKALRSPGFRSQFQFLRDDTGEPFLRYTEDAGTKTNKGGLKHRKVEPKTVDLYLTRREERCPIRVISKYLSLLPKARTCPAFYLQPRKKYFGKAWYINKVAGVNRLKDTVRELCKAAGIPGHFTNHSLRSTVATKMYQSNLDEQLIQEVTGHRSLAVRAYKMTSAAQRKMAS